MILTSAAVIAVGVGAYGLGRVYPPLGPSAGTVAPAQRYVSSQVGDKDVTLGDTSVPELMQTDAFEAMVHDPQFRTLAHDANFTALAQNPVAMSALAAHANSFKALAANPEHFRALAHSAQQLSANNGAASAVGSQRRRGAGGQCQLVQGARVAAGRVQRGCTACAGIRAARQLPKRHAGHAAERGGVQQIRRQRGVLPASRRQCRIEQCDGAGRQVVFGACRRCEGDGGNPQ